jgi:hypothetical protein
MKVEKEDLLKTFDVFINDVIIANFDTLKSNVIKDGVDVLTLEESKDIIKKFNMKPDQFNIYCSSASARSGFGTTLARSLREVKGFTIWFHSTTPKGQYVSISVGYKVSVSFGKYFATRECSQCGTGRRKEGIVKFTEKDLNLLLKRADDAKANANKEKIASQFDLITMCSAVEDKVKWTTNKPSYASGTSTHKHLSGITIRTEGGSNSRKKYGYPTVYRLEITSLPPYKIKKMLEVLALEDEECKDE